MHPMLLYFDLFVLLMRVYSSYMFPMENEMIDKVYYELRDLVKMKTSMVNKPVKDSNETVSPSKTNFNGDDSHVIEANNKTSKTEPLEHSKMNSSAVKDIKDSSSSFNKKISLDNSTEASEKLQSKADEDISKTNQTDKSLTSSNPIQEDDSNKNMSGKVEGEKSGNSSSETSNSYQSNDDIMNAIVHEIKNILPVKRQKRMQSLHLTNEIEDILPITNERKGKSIPYRIKRNTGKETLFHGELTDEIEDILPVLNENEKESHAIRRKREIEEENTINGELTNEIEDILEGYERKKREVEEENILRDELIDEIEDILEMPVRTKRNSEKSSIMDDAITDDIGSHLTDEIQDVQLERRERVPIRPRSVGSNRLWETQPSFQPNPEDIPNISNNHMNHNRHFVENDQHHIHSDHSIHPEENEHAYHQERGHSSHFNDNSGHHHSHHDIHNQGHAIESHHEEESQEPRKEHWSSYHHGKFHHVKVKLHGPGKTPSEWARQEEQELAEYPGVIYDSGVYHDVGMDAGFYLMRCEDCIS